MGKVVRTRRKNSVRRKNSLRRKNRVRRKVKRSYSKSRKRNTRNKRRKGGMKHHKPWPWDRPLKKVSAGLVVGAGAGGVAGGLVGGPLGIGVGAATGAAAGYGLGLGAASLGADKEAKKPNRISRPEQYGVGGIEMNETDDNWEKWNKQKQKEIDADIRGDMKKKDKEMKESLLNTPHQSRRKGLFGRN